jgi:hypothetical protein
VARSAAKVLALAGVPNPETAGATWRPNRDRRERGMLSPSRESPTVRVPPPTRKMTMAGGTTALRVRGRRFVICHIAGAPHRAPWSVPPSRWRRKANVLHRGVATEPVQSARTSLARTTPIPRDSTAYGRTLRSLALVSVSTRHPAARPDASERLRVRDETQTAETRRSPCRL